MSVRYVNSQWHSILKHDHPQVELQSMFLDLDLASNSNRENSQSQSVIADTRTLYPLTTANLNFYLLTFT